MSAILIVDDERGIRTLCAEVLRRAGHTVTTAETAEEALALDSAFDLVLADVHLPGADGIQLLHQLHVKRPDLPVLLITGFPTVEDAVRGMKEGARDYLTKPFAADELRLVVSRALEESALRHENAALRHELAFGNLVGGSPRMRALFAMIEKVARTDLPVLVTGESGTGKELVARAVHYHGARAAKPFMAVNCGALVGNLFESELFGHVRGAFTGAAQARPGLFVAASGGTLFLDEIGELAPEMQPKLLRVLESGELKPVGGEATAHVDTRVVAATNRDLAREAAAGRFREDLLYRLNVVALEVPPLRDRPEDIPLLVEHFIERIAERARRPRPELTAAASEWLAAQPWPGNVRELENAIERAVVLASGRTLDVSDFVRRTGPASQPPPAAASAPAADYPFTNMSLEELERMHITQVLAVCDGQKGRAAAILGINRTTLWKKLTQYGVE